MKWIYFKWQPVNTIVLIVTIALLVWYILSNGERNFTGFLIIISGFILHKIYWIGRFKDALNEKDKEIEFLKNQI